MPVLNKKKQLCIKPLLLSFILTMCKRGGQEVCDGQIGADHLGARSLHG
jgi:hypothetical protein